MEHMPHRFLRFATQAGLMGAAVCCAHLAAAEPTGGAFDFAALEARAQALASRPYRSEPAPIPEWLRALTYDQYRDIRFRPDETWWGSADLPFRLQFFPPGFLMRQTVAISEVNGNWANPISFSRNFFDYGHNTVGDIPPSLGFAGFKILYPLNKADDETGVFAGASYFRFLCKSTVYGLSARGLAVDTAEPTPEEFPDFKEFWVVRPGARAASLTVYALLDGPSESGAYRFVISPGADTVMDIHAVFFCRRNPKVFGVAPLTSMFWHGKNSNEELDDFRPEVHDSDGLMIRTSRNEWIWRPLTNSSIPRVASFMDENPRGFGLLQRERRFECYEDLESNYQARPSAWVEPRGDWGKGSVRLVELFAPDETNDNIVAFWVPDRLPQPGQPVTFDYRLHWHRDQIEPPNGYTVATRHGRSRTQEPGLEHFVIDFDGPAIQRQPDNGFAQAVVTVGAGAALAHPPNLDRNPFDRTWKVDFAVKPDGSRHPVELKCYLRNSGGTLTETWTYLWQP
jgi:periplasmic glucans biosynthesis protein